jgi:hypothetical protein
MVTNYRPSLSTKFETKKKFFFIKMSSTCKQLMDAATLRKNVPPFKAEDCPGQVKQGMSGFFYESTKRAGGWSWVQRTDIPSGKVPVVLSGGTVVLAEPPLPRHSPGRPTSPGRAHSPSHRAVSPGRAHSPSHRAASPGRVTSTSRPAIPAFPFAASSGVAPVASPGRTAKPKEFHAGREKPHAVAAEHKGEVMVGGDGLKYQSTPRKGGGFYWKKHESSSPSPSSPRGCVPIPESKASSIHTPLFSAADCQHQTKLGRNGKYWTSTQRNNGYWYWKEESAARPSSPAHPASPGERCVKQTTAKMTDPAQRPLPPYIATDCPGSTRMGNDGQMYYSKPTAGRDGAGRQVHRWTLVSQAVASPARK